MCIIDGSQCEQYLGRSRGGFSSKIHPLVDALGFPLRFILTGGERHDITQAASLLAPFAFGSVSNDRAYDCDALRQQLQLSQVAVVIPSRRHRKQQRDYDPLRYKERNIVERFINRIKWYRHIFTRYEKLARQYMAFLHLASTLIWLKRNVNDLDASVLGLSGTAGHACCSWVSPWTMGWRLREGDRNSITDVTQ